MDLHKSRERFQEVKISEVSRCLRNIRANLRRINERMRLENNLPNIGRSKNSSRAMFGNKISSNMD